MRLKDKLIDEHAKGLGDEKWKRGNTKAINSSMCKKELQTKTSVEKKIRELVSRSINNVVPLLLQKHL